MFLKKFIIINSLLSLNANADFSPSVTSSEVNFNTRNNSNNFEKVSLLDPDPNGNLMIPAGKKYLLDKSLNVSKLMINGELYCPTKGKIKIVADTVMVKGRFTCGTKLKPFMGDLHIALKESNLMGMENRSIHVMSGGLLELHGKLKTHKLNLQKNISVGQNTLTLEKAPKNWSIGDEILISTTDMNMLHNERLKIKNIIGNIVTLANPVKFFHQGELLNVQGHQYDERAFVTNLTRNIKINSFGNDHESTQKGAHAMIMNGGVGKVSSVSFQSMGRQGELGRYPFHWHKAGNIPGQYIKNSVIKDSYQRCIVIHSSNHTKVLNNVCVNHFGHGIFLEHGDERKNTIKGNIVAISKKTPMENSLLASESVGGPDGRYPAPASFWVSNPDNIIENNIAAGSEGSGFWNAFVNFAVCDLSSPCKLPLNENTLAFNKNVASANKVGFTWDGAPSKPTHNIEDGNAPLINAHYSPAVKAVFKGLRSYNNWQTGVYFRGDSATFEDCVFGDNMKSVFFALSQELKNSIIVGHSPNYPESDKELIKFVKKEQFKTPTGVVIYDGPFALENVQFLNFPSSPINWDGHNITPIPFVPIGAHARYENVVKGLIFKPEPIVRVQMFAMDWFTWNDTLYSISLRDLDGSLTGKAGTLVTPIHPLNQGDNCIAHHPSYSYLCEDQEMASFQFLDFENTPAPTYFNISVNESEALNTIVGLNHNKFNTILNSGNTYEVSPLKGFWVLKEGRREIMVRFSREGEGMSELLHIKDAYNCQLGNPFNQNMPPAPSAASLEELKSADDTMIFNTDKGVYLKIKTYHKNPAHEKAQFSDTYTENMQLSCEL